jgi:hypothetical protein
VSVRVYGKVATVPILSVTVKVTLLLELAVLKGVPLRTPALERVSPVPVNPVAEKVYGDPPPPVAVNVVLVYAAPGIPRGKVVGETAIAAFTVSVGEALDVAPLASVTVTLTVYGVVLLVPVAGVPVMMPLVLLMLSPVGKPVCVHLTAGAPPVSVNIGVVAAVVYAEATVAMGSVAGPVSVGAAYTVRVYGIVATDPELSVTCTVNELAPGVPVGVPLINPVAPLVPVAVRFKPVGSGLEPEASAQV